MDELISKLENLTANVVKKMENITFEELEKFVVERQAIIDNIGTSYLMANILRHQRERIHLLLEQDSIITARMQILMIEAQDWLQQRNLAKMKRNLYSSAYTPDSILMDRKK